LVSEEARASKGELTTCEKLISKESFGWSVEQELGVTSQNGFTLQGTGTMAELARMCPSETVIPSRQ
jgi:hypothetical protein